MRKLALVLMLSAISVASADVLLDNIGTPANYGGNVYASQEFEAAFAGYNIATIDNFTIPAGPGYKLNTVEAIIGFWNGPASFTNVQNYRVEIYSSVAAAATNLTGDKGHYVAATYTNIVRPWGAGTFGEGKITLDVNAGNIVLAPGTYYIGVVPRMDFTGIGQSGVGGTNLGDLNAWQTNPGGAFGFPGNKQQISPGTSAGYLITGTLVPEPASLALVALGALVLVRRR